MYFAENQMQLTTTFRGDPAHQPRHARRRSTRHPSQPPQGLFLPRAAIVHMSKGEKGFWSIEIPENLG